jgi:hypothetical protein
VRVTFEVAGNQRFFGVVQDLTLVLGVNEEISIRDDCGLPEARFHSFALKKNVLIALVVSLVTAMGEQNMFQQRSGECWKIRQLWFVVS